MNEKRKMTTAFENEQHQEQLQASMGKRDRIPAYCTQNDGDCETCSLVNYGRDCRNNPIRDFGDYVETNVT